MKMGLIALPVVAGARRARRSGMVERKEVREEIRAIITGYTTSLREAHEFAGESQTQTDNLLGWTAGLMGAALFAAPTLLAGMGVSMERDVVRVLVLLPWVLGVLFGVAGRLLALELRDSNNLYIAEKLHALDFLLVADLDAVTMKGNFQATLNDEGEHGARLARTKRIQLWTRIFYYATYLALAAGAIAIFLAAVYGSRLHLAV
jgi:hypothetical protein